jgi:hypothetical protein
MKKQEEQEDMVEGAAEVQMTAGYSMFDMVFVWPRCGQDKELATVRHVPWNLRPNRFRTD